jgi:IrrE N-terminal-like domain
MLAMSAENDSGTPPPETPRFEPRELLKLGRAEVERFVTSLATETDQVRKTEHFQAWLATVSRFWRYSFWNQFFIRRDCPHARWVGARTLWASLGRTVRADEKPIAILAPARRAGPRFFIVVEVFDVSQTEGKPLPEPSWVVTGGSPIVEVVERAAQRLDIRVENVAGDGTFLGRTIGRYRIQMVADLSPAERAATLVHECAHALLHADDLPKRRGAKPLSHADREIQAEGVAYVVLKAAGQPTTAPTYLAANFGASLSPSRVRDSLRDITRASREILRAMAGDLQPARRLRARKRKP